MYYTYYGAMASAVVWPYDLQLEVRIMQNDVTQMGNAEGQLYRPLSWGPDPDPNVDSCLVFGQGFA